MMFADDLILCAMTRGEVEEVLDTWRVVFERHGLNISRTQTEYLPSPTNDTGTTVKIVDVELPKVLKTIIRLAMTYGSEWWAVKKKDENKLTSAEMRMLRWARGNTRLDHIRT